MNLDILPLDVILSSVSRPQQYSLEFIWDVENVPWCRNANWIDEWPNRPRLRCNCGRIWIIQFGVYCRSRVNALYAVVSESVVLTCWWQVAKLQELSAECYNGTHLTALSSRNRVQPMALVCPNLSNPCRISWIEIMDTPTSRLHQNCF
jgi:hypothetical protein